MIVSYLTVKNIKKNILPAEAPEKKCKIFFSNSKMVPFMLFYTKFAAYFCILKILQHSIIVKNKFTEFYHVAIIVIECIVPRNFPNTVCLCEM